MNTTSTLLHRHRVQRAIQWLSWVGVFTVRTINDACVRFDLTPAECQFLYSFYGLCAGG